jgi:Lon protease-like protein
MILPEATLFPQAMLPLFIFEPRYRRMLAEVLDGQRLFVVACQKPGMPEESPAAVAGLGLIRACVGHRDGTSHLVLQGIARVRLQGAVCPSPYPFVRINPVESIGHGSAAEETLVANVRELVAKLVRGAEFFKHTPDGSQMEVPSRALHEYLDSQQDAAQLADLVSSALLPDARERQTILELVDVEQRLRKLVQFLLAQVRLQRKNPARE